MSRKFAIFVGVLILCSCEDEATSPARPTIPSYVTNAECLYYTIVIHDGTGMRAFFAVTMQTNKVVVTKRHDPCEPIDANFNLFETNVPCGDAKHEFGITNEQFVKIKRKIFVVVKGNRNDCGQYQEFACADSAIDAVTEHYALLPFSLRKRGVHCDLEIALISSERAYARSYVNTLPLQYETLTVLLTNAFSNASTHWLSSNLLEFTKLVKREELEYRQLLFELKYGFFLRMGGKAGTHITSISDKLGAVTNLPMTSNQPAACNHDQPPPSPSAKGRGGGAGSCLNATNSISQSPP